MKICGGNVLHFQKYLEPYDDLNPTFNLGIFSANEITELNPVIFLTKNSAGFEKTENFMLIQKPHKVDFLGVSADHTIFQFTVPTPDRKVNCEIQMYAWKHDSRMYFLNMVYKAEEGDEKTKVLEEYQTILNSLTNEWE